MIALLNLGSPHCRRTKAIFASARARHALLLLQGSRREQADGSIKIREEAIDYFLRRYREEVIRKRKASQNIEAQLAAFEAQAWRTNGSDDGTGSAWNAGGLASPGRSLSDEKLVDASLH